MQKKTVSALASFAAFVIVVHACTRLGDDTKVDARMGEMGKVRFEGGGGCNSSTTLAIGSTAVMTLEPQQEALPADLGVRSTEPDVIGAASGSAIDEVVLEAHAGGESRVELLSAGGVWDWLDFEAEAARSITYTAGDAVFSGGTYPFVIDEVYGECGEQCPLIGGEFVLWGSSPEGALVLDGEAHRTSLFVAGDPQEASLDGAEPSTGLALVNHAVTIADPAASGDLDADVLIYLPDETLLDPQPAPVELPAGSLCQFRFFADAGGTRVPISRYDVSWTITGDPGVLEDYELEPFGSPEGPIFSTLAPGSVTLEVTSSLIDRSGFFDVIVTE
jgi:hypothetical protein